VNIAVVSDRHFQDLCRALGLDQLGLDSRFVSNEGRVKHRADLAAAISAALAQQSTSHWVEVIGASGVPVGRVLDLAAVFADEQVIHNEMLVEVEHPRAGTVRLQGSPFRIDRSAARAKGVPPSLGEHTREILMGQGWSGERVDDLARAGSLVAG
jgi:crotonobetainyl-CoA:carnitine CoA-transferase CaiB-like acyl-CoA transferase